MKKYSKLIDNAYAPIGGHPNYKSSDNVTGRESDAEYVVIDLDNDPEIDAISVTKKKQQVKSLQQQDMMVLVLLNLEVVNHKS